MLLMLSICSYGNKIARTVVYPSLLSSFLFMLFILFRKSALNIFSNFSARTSTARALSIELLKQCIHSFHSLRSHLFIPDRPGGVRCADKRKKKIALDNVRNLAANRCRSSIGRYTNKIRTIKQCPQIHHLFRSIFCVCMHFKCGVVTILGQVFLFVVDCKRTKINKFSSHYALPATLHEFESARTHHIG